MTQPAPRHTMPGAFKNHSAGRKSHIFQPPVTPSASSSQHLTRSMISTYSEDSERSTAAGRKRTRNDYISEAKATPVSRRGNWTKESDTGDSMARSNSLDLESPMPFVNTRYALAGGLDTPQVAAAAAEEAADSVYSDMNYRRNLGGDGLKDSHNLSYFPRIETPTSHNSRASNQAGQREGWSKVALEVVGGVVGKVWDFCRTGAFRGFISGGGTGYNNNAQPYQSEKNFWGDEPTTSDRFGDVVSTPLPGQFPDDDFIPDYMDNPTPDQGSQRPAKRRQVSKSEDELGKNWIMVSNVANATTISTAPTIASTTPTPLRTTKPTATATSSTRYSMPTTSSSSRRQPINSAASRPASRAGNRRTLPSTYRGSTVSHAGSSNLNPMRPASYASPRSPTGSKIPVLSTNSRYTSPTKTSSTGIATPSSPAAIEAQKWVAKKKREEREAEESIQRFNKQLRDMIREGKEALGSKVVVEDDMEMDVEGYDDGELIGKGW